MNTIYFSHDANAGQDIKMRLLRKRGGSEAYGNYWLIVEILRRTDDYKIKLNDIFYEYISEECNNTKEYFIDFFKLCCDLELFVIENNYLFSVGLMKRMERMEEERAKKSRAGKASAKKRAQQSEHTLNNVEHTLNNVEHTLNTVEQIKETKLNKKKTKLNIKEKEKKEKESEEIPESERIYTYNGKEYTNQERYDQCINLYNHMCKPGGNIKNEWKFEVLNRCQSEFNNVAQAVKDYINTIRFDMEKIFSPFDDHYRPFIEFVVEMKKKYIGKYNKYPPIQLDNDDKIKRDNNIRRELSLKCLMNPEKKEELIAEANEKMKNDYNDDTLNVL